MKLPRKYHQRGLTLVEVLVAAVILGIGLLGVASLQIHALRNVKISGDTQAVSVQVNELVEMMRMNADNAADYHGLTTAVCAAPADRAQEDFCDVWSRLSNQLSNATASLTVTSCPGPNAVCSITAQWTPRNTYESTEAPVQRTFSMSVRL